ncbi:hypothetical protein ADUPG1_008272, partial [Aduncisulcus paluster]
MDPKPSSESGQDIIQEVKPKFIHEGNYLCSPIPRDSPNVKSPDITAIEAKNTWSYWPKEEGDEDHDMSFHAQKMMKGENNQGEFTDISLSFSTSTPFKGAYICIKGYSLFSWQLTSHLIFSFTSSNGEKMVEKYEFPEFEGYHWYYLPIDLSDVVLCEITGKGREEEYFGIRSLVFISREETSEEITSREAREKLWSEAPVVKPEFLKEGGTKFQGRDSIPIPRDHPKLINPSFSLVQCKNNSYCKESEFYDKCSEAQEMLKGESVVTLSQLSIPFPSPSPMKGAYICVNNYSSSPSLLFTFTDSDVFLQQRIVLGKVELKYSGHFSCIPIPRDDPTFISPDFSAIKAKSKLQDDSEYDVSNQVQNMMKGECNYVDFSHISIPFKSSASIKRAYICLIDKEIVSSLLFTFTSLNGNKKTFYLFKFDEFSDVTNTSWYDLSIDLPDVILCEIEGKRVKDGRIGDNFPIHSLAFYREETPDEEIDREKRKILLEERWLKSSPIQSKIKKWGDIPSRLDPSIINPLFSDVQGKNDVYCKESEKYDQNLKVQKMLKGEAHGVKLSWLSIPFSPSLIKDVYIRFDEYRAPALLFTFTLSDDKKISKKYEFINQTSLSPHFVHPEWHFLSIDLPKAVLSVEIQGNVMWRHDSRIFRIDSLIFIGEGVPLRRDSFTLTSSATITPQCIIGHGGFGEVLLVKVEGISIPCVLKKMLHEADEKVVKTCRKEFKVQLKLFNNPKCFNRISRPLYILDLLDADLKGVYGFLMEFCIGGSVSSFAKKWCVVDKSESQLQGDGKEEEEEECSSSEEDSDDHKDFDLMSLNPLKVSALCVGMIECLDDVFTAKPKLVHRDIKPDNFLVRVDPKDGECTVVLSDLGMVQILDSLSSRLTSSGVTKVSSHSSKIAEKGGKPEPQRSICGTLVYNSYEALRGYQSQKSDAYSLGMSILALFMGDHPFTNMPGLRGIYNRSDFVLELCRILKGDMGPTLKESPLFKSLLSIEKGEFRSVHACLNEVFTGLTKFDEDERMSVHEAREKVKTVKDLLPEIGEGFECPSIDDIVKTQLAKYGGNPGCIGEEGKRKKAQYRKIGSGFLNRKDGLEKEKKGGQYDEKTSYGEEDESEKEKIDDQDLFPFEQQNKENENRTISSYNDDGREQDGIASFPSSSTLSGNSINPKVEEGRMYQTQIVKKDSFAHSFPSKRTSIDKKDQDAFVDGSGKHLFPPASSSFSASPLSSMSSIHVTQVQSLDHDKDHDKAHDTHIFPFISPISSELGMKKGDEIRSILSQSSSSSSICDMGARKVKQEEKKKELSSKERKDQRRKNSLSHETSQEEVLPTQTGSATTARAEPPEEDKMSEIELLRKEVLILRERTIRRDEREKRKEWGLSPAGTLLLERLDEMRRVFSEELMRGPFTKELLDTLFEEFTYAFAAADLLRRKIAFDTSRDVFLEGGRD